MGDQPPLFDPTPFLVEGPTLDEDAPLSADRRRTIRFQQMIRDGIHPLMRGPLHEQASTARTAASGGNDPFTCGTCCHRLPGGARYSWPKCEIGRRTASASTDVRAWWPACPQYLPTRPVAPPT